LFQHSSQLECSPADVGLNERRPNLWSCQLIVAKNSVQVVHDHCPVHDVNATVVKTPPYRAVQNLTICRICIKNLFYVHLNNVVLSFIEFKKYLKIRISLMSKRPGTGFSIYGWSHSFLCVPPWPDLLHAVAVAIGWHLIFLTTCLFRGLVAPCSELNMSLGH